MSISYSALLTAGLLGGLLLAGSLVPVQADPDCGKDRLQTQTNSRGSAVSTAVQASTQAFRD